jgi:predicted PurR-regulated permease PerM
MADPQLLAGAEDRAELRARRGWAELQRRLRRVAPADIGRLLLSLIVLVLIVWLAIASWPALLPFLVGGFLVYTLLPVVNTLNRLLPRPLAAIITFASFLVLVVAIFGTLGPALSSQTIRLYQSALTPAQLAAWRAQLDDYVAGQEEPLRSVLDDFVTRVGVALQNELDGLIDGLAATSVAGTIGIVNTLGLVVGALLLPLWMLALMIRQRRARDALNILVPTPIWADTWAVLRIIDRVLRAFLGGRLVLGIAAGLIFYLILFGLHEIGIGQGRYLGLAALFVGLLQLIPQIGPLIGMIVLGTLAFATSIESALLIVGAYMATQILVTILVARRIERRLTDLNPVVLTLFIAALSQFGLVWILFSAPLMAITRDLLRYAYGRLADPPRPAGLLPGEPLPRGQSVLYLSSGRRAAGKDRPR